MSASPEPSPDTAPTPPGRWRGWVGRSALVLACIALFVANLAVFLRVFVFDKGTFVDAVAPKKADPAVVDALAGDLSRKLLRSDAVQEKIDELTPRDNPLVAAVVNDVGGRVVRTVVTEVLESDAFRTVWRAALGRAHDRFISIVEDDSREPVVLDITKALQTVDKRLEKRGIDIIDPATIRRVGDEVALRRDQVDEVRTYLNLLRQLAAGAAVATVVFAAVALLVAVDRRRMLLRLGIGTMVAMAVTAVVFRVSRRILLNRVRIDSRRDAVESLWDRVFDQLRTQTLTLFLLGALAVGIAWLVGPSPSAQKLRDAVRGKSSSPPRPAPAR